MAGFEWDSEKNKRNLQKHRMPLSVGIPVFSDFNRVEFVDSRQDYGEDRYVTIGVNRYTKILSVVYTVRHGDTIRLISVRPASKRERDDYHSML